MKNYTSVTIERKSSLSVTIDWTRFYPLKEGLIAFNTITVISFSSAIADYKYSFKSDLSALKAYNRKIRELEHYF